MPLESVAPRRAHGRNENPPVIKPAPYPPKLARVPSMDRLADASEFPRAEVDAFMRRLKRERPLAWQNIRRLQELCRRERVASVSGRVVRSRPPIELRR